MNLRLGVRSPSHRLEFCLSSRSRGYDGCPKLKSKMLDLNRMFKRIMKFKLLPGREWKLPSTQRRSSPKIVKKNIRTSTNKEGHDYPTGMGEGGEYCRLRRRIVGGGIKYCYIAPHGRRSEGLGLPPFSCQISRTGSVRRDTVWAGGIRCGYLAPNGRRSAMPQCRRTGSAPAR
jgi:hypothetical protein